MLINLFAMLLFYPFLFFVVFKKMEKFRKKILEIRIANIDKSTIHQADQIKINPADCSF